MEDYIFDYTQLFSILIYICNEEFKNPPKFKLSDKRVREDSAGFSNKRDLSLYLKGLGTVTETAK